MTPLTREQRVVLGLVLCGSVLFALAVGEVAVSKVFGRYNHEEAQWFVAAFGLVLLVAAFVLREVFRNRSK